LNAVAPRQNRTISICKTIRLLAACFGSICIFSSQAQVVNFDVPGGAGATN
jgi:hypothetical protein